jgi:hypothetical protein
LTTSIPETNINQIYKNQKEIMKMKNIENMKALNDMAMEAVAGGDDDYTVVDAFVDWLLSPVEEALNNIADNVAGGSDDDDRPLPFPQNRRGNKAPFEAPHKAGPLFL